MKTYKILITLLLIVLTIGAVSASDNITQDLTSPEQSTAGLNESDFEEYLTPDIEVEENIDILPVPGEKIRIYGIEHTSGNFSLSIDGEKQNAAFTSEYMPPEYIDILTYLEFDATNLTYGQHRYDINFTGDDIYGPATKSGTLTVSPIVLKVPSQLHLLNTYENNRDVLDNRGYISMEYLKNLTGNAYLYINGVRKTINLSDFKAKGYPGKDYDGYSCFMYDFQEYKLINLDESEKYYVYWEYYYFDQSAEITMKYANITKTAFVNVSYDVNCNREILKGTDLEIYFPKDSLDKISVEIDGKKTGIYTKRIDADYYRLHFYAKTSSLDYGKHTIKIISPLCTLSKTFSVVGNPVSPKTASVYYTDGKTLTLTVYGAGKKAVAEGESVYLYIDGTFYACKYANKNGKISVKIPKSLKPGTHTVTVQTWDDYWDIAGKVKLTVKHVVGLKSVKVKKSAKKLVLTASLKKGKTPLKAKQITFKFNGKTYKAKTNSKGIAKVTVKKTVLKKLKVGKKIAYSATYLKDTVKRTVKVKK